MHVSVFYFLLIAFSILVYMLFSYSAFRLQECSIKSVSQSVKPITFWMSVKQERDDKVAETSAGPHTNHLDLNQSR